MKHEKCSIESKLLCRVSEAAEQLSVARTKAYNMVQTGELASVRIGKSIRVPVSALHAYVQRLVAAAAAKPEAR